MKTIDRAQEWLADRISWVQYPNIQKQRVVKPSPFEGKKLSWVDAGLLLLAAFYTGIAGIMAMAVGGFMLFVLFKVLF